MLDDGIRGIPRNIAYGDASALCGFYIDIVIACGKKSDIAQVLAFFHYFIRYQGLIAYNGIAVGNHVGEHIVRHRIIKSHVAE